MARTSETCRRLLKHLALLPFAALLALAAVQPAMAKGEVGPAQQFLTALGYNPGPIDGAWGGKTRNALIAFYVDRGGEFDGTLSANEIEDLVAELAKIPFNGAPPKLSVANGKTNYIASFDFIPPSDLAAQLPQLEDLVPFERVADRIYDRAAGYSDRGVCKWVDGEEFPKPQRVIET
ncbi:MAG: peptidoglycan-binding domain-containing protein, partial [Alphaproteobacteria bacterium]